MNTISPDPLRGPLGWLFKFLGAGLFGCFVSLLLFLASLAIELDFLWTGWWPHVFWVIPLVWGVLGLFWFEPMLELARKIVEDSIDIWK